MSNTAGGDPRFACPVDGCDNEELDVLEDDSEDDYFCHWCGNLFDAGEVEDDE